MKTTIEKLMAKKNLLLVDNSKFDDRVRLNKTTLFSTMRNNVRNMCKMRAIDLAIDIINNGTNSIDVDLYATDIIHPQRSDREEWLNIAMFGTYCEKQRLLVFLIETYLPICKKQILTLIN